MTEANTGSADTASLVDFSKQPNFLYTALPAGHIRVLTIHGTKPVRLVGSEDDIDEEIVICCSLELLALSDVASNHVEYNALSYVWGQKSTVHHLLINEILRPVTRNLYDALYHLYLNAKPDGFASLLWVDAISINQDDDEEKTRQVAMMGSIYSKAAKILIWLGTGAEQAGPSFDQVWDFTKNVDTLHESQLSAFSTFLERCYWFRRTWTFQEIVLARAAHIIHPRGIVDWPSFVARVFSIAQLWADKHRSVIYNSIQTVEELRRRNQLWSLSTLLAVSAGRYASYPHDRIFSFLGLYDGSHRLEINYKQPVEAVGAQAAMILDREAGYSVSLALVRSTDRSTRKRYDLRSWIPDWQNIVYGSYRTALDSYWRHERSGGNHEYDMFLDPKLGSAEGPVASSDPGNLETNFRKHDMTALHPTFTMETELDGSRLVMQGALMSYWLTWWCGTDSSKIESLGGEYEQLPFPDCVRKKSRQMTSAAWNRPEKGRLLSPDVYEPMVQDSKTIFLQLVAHEEMKCQCVDGDQREDSFELELERFLRRKFAAHFPKWFGDFRARPQKKGVYMVWRCFLYGHAEEILVQPWYDKDRDEVVCYISAFSGEGGFNDLGALQIIGEGRVRLKEKAAEPFSEILKLRSATARARFARKYEFGELSNFSSADLQEAHVESWRTPEDVFRVNTTPSMIIESDLYRNYSWIPVRLTLSDQPASSCYNRSIEGFNIPLPHERSP